jgi:hypothetical protein
MFDGANRQTCKVRSSITCTPLHALTTLNDLTWSEAARVLAQHSMVNAVGAPAQITYAFRRVLGRTPTGTELALLQRALDKQHSIYKADPTAAAKVISLGNSGEKRDQPADGDPIAHAALTNLCLALFNLDEALTRE